MNNLFDAIYAKFIADGKYGLTALYNTEADAKAVYPYAVFSLVAAATESADFTEDWETCLIQFNLFDDDPVSTDISTAYKALKDAFHKFDLDVDSAEVVSLEKGVATLTRIEKVWQYNINFRIKVQE